MSGATAQFDGVPSWMADKGVKKGEWLDMTKASLRTLQRPDRVLKVQVWATGMLHTAGYKGEEATRMRNGKLVPLTPADIIAELFARAKEFYTEGGIKFTEAEIEARKETKEHIRRVLEDLERDGIALRTDRNGTPLRELSMDQLRRLPGGNTRLFLWLTPRAADPDKVAREWQRTTPPLTTPDDTSESDVATPGLPIPSISKILKIFQIDLPDKSILADPGYQKAVARGYLASRELFIQVASEWLPTERPPDVASETPPDVATEPLHKVATPRGAFESKVESKVETTTTTPVPAAPRARLDVVVVGEKLREYRDHHITDSAVEAFCAECREPENAPECTTEDVVAVIRQKGKSLDKLSNPIGALIRQVPKLLSKYIAGKQARLAQEPKCWNCSGSLAGGSVNGACFACIEANEKAKGAGS